LILVRSLLDEDNNLVFLSTSLVGISGNVYGLFVGGSYLNMLIGNFVSMVENDEKCWMKLMLIYCNI
jgi:hypothetical protein